MRAGSVLLLTAGMLGACSAIDFDQFSRPPKTSGAPEAGVDGATGTADPSLSDQDEATFGRGQYLETAWIGDHVALRPGKSSGDYVSRVFDLGTERRTARLEWTPRAPYLKALPDGAKAEEGYRFGSVNMGGNLLLLHFDGSFSETSGRALSVVGFDVFGPGRFGRAFDDTLATIATAPWAALASGTADFTWAVWVRSTFRCDTAADPSGYRGCYMGGEDDDVRPHLWIGGKCCAGGTVPHLTGYLAATSSDGVELGCGTRPVDDGKWHHVAVVKSGHATGTAKLFLDGTLETTTTTGFTSPVAFDSATARLSFGGFRDSFGQGEGTLDDAAVFQRALSDEEIANLASRGRLRLSFQFRSCSTVSCDGSGPFIGPGASPDESFVDVGLAPPARADLSFGQPTRFIQYRAHFESDDSTISPELDTVRIVTP